MLIVDSSAAKMEVGEHLTFIVTNEIHDFNFFWQIGIAIMIIFGFDAFSFGFFQRVSHEVKESAKYLAPLTAGLVIFNIIDELRFLFGTLHKNR